jgi:Uma2 family endonuclease
MASALEIENYTYADFLEWKESTLAELLDGEIVMMAPPATIHQLVSGEFFSQLKNFLKGKRCKVFAAPFGVRLFPRKDRSDNTVFLPDIVVVCDPEKLDDKGCNGAPDLVIEILSPSTAKYDWRAGCEPRRYNKFPLQRKSLQLDCEDFHKITKFRKYQTAGVKEYWIVDPDLKNVQVCILENGRYMVTMYDDTEKAPIGVLQGCEIDLPAVFEE